MQTLVGLPAIHRPPKPKDGYSFTATPEAVDSRYSLYYLGGPTIGAHDWREEAIAIIAEQTAEREIPTNIFTPVRANSDRIAGLGWETYRISDAIGTFSTLKYGKDTEGVTNVYNTCLGGVLFWFPRQTQETPPGYSYALQSITALARITSVCPATKKPDTGTWRYQAMHA